MISVLQSSLCIGDIASTVLSRSSTEGAFIISKNTFEGRGAPVLLTWLTNLHAHFPLLGYFLRKNLRRKPPTFGLCPNIFQASDPLPCCFCLHGQR
jgi:hypothetical protein